MPTQNHIHLSPTLGAAPENAPDVLWKVRVDAWLPVPNIVQNNFRSLTGKLKKHRLRSGGNVVQFMDYKYTLVIRDHDGYTKDERWDLIRTYQGLDLYLVDVLHVPDGFDHTSQVRQVYLESIDDVTNINPQLDPLYITINLKDDSL